MKILEVAQRHARALLLFAVAALAVVVLVPNLGGPGLWDPWEMDRAHVAREMAGPTKAYVVEPRGEDGAAGPLAARIAELHPETYRLVDGPKRKRSKAAAARRKAALTDAQSALGRGALQVLVIELSELLESTDDRATLGEVANALNDLALLHPGLRVAVDVDGISADPDAVAVAMGRSQVAAGIRGMQARWGLLRELPVAKAQAVEEQLGGEPGFRPDFTFFAGPQDAAFGELLADVEGAQRTQALLRADGQTWAVPVLDYWLVSTAYRVLGVSETSARLPALVWALLGVLLVVWLTLRLFGPTAAVLAGVALVTMPMFAGQARHLSGDISFTVTLTAAFGAFLLMAREGLSVGRLVLFVAGLVLAFLSNGLTALLLVSVLLLAYVLAMGAWRRGTLVPLAIAAGIFGVAALLVFLPDGWTFFDHFRFMDRLYEGGPIRDVRTIDFFVSQLGFGLFPWSALLPVALGRLWWKARTSEDVSADDGEASAESLRNNEAIYGVVLWFALPFAVLSLLLKDFSHCVYPAVPAIAVACGVLLADILDGDRQRGFMVFFVFVLLLILAKQLGESPAPATSFLTYDPPFSEKTSTFPAEVTFARPVKYLVMMAGLLLLVFGMRLGTMARAGAQIFRRPGPYWTAIFAIAGVLVLALFGTLMWKFDVSLSRPEARGLQPIDRMGVKSVMGGPLAIVIYVLLAAALLIHLVGYSAWGRERTGILRRLVAKLSDRVPQRWFLVAAGALLVVSAGALFAMLAGAWGELAGKLFPEQDDTVVRDLLLKGRAVLLPLGLAFVLTVNRLWVEPWRRWALPFRALELFERPRFAVGAFVFAAAVSALTITHSLYAELSLHVSQKHILQNYYEAEQRDDMGENLFRHGSFARSGERDANFYTAQIPEVSDRKAVIAALDQKRPTTLRVDDGTSRRAMEVASYDTSKERVYFLLPKQSFSDLNHAFRKVSGGQPIHLLNADSSRLVLAVSRLAEGEADANWITAALAQESELTTRDWYPESEGDTFHPVRANWDDKIEIIGWTMETEKVSRRQDYKIKMFFRCKGEMKHSYKIFMHVDRSGTSHRIHSDHWPLNLEKSPGDDPEKTCRGCFQTKHWMPGDIYVDTFTREVPLGTPSGPQDIWLGFYNPSTSKRLKIKDFDKDTVRHDGQNRVRIGSFEVN